jgi:hypothetical protein
MQCAASSCGSLPQVLSSATPAAEVSAKLSGVPGEAVSYRPGVENHNCDLADHKLLRRISWPWQYRGNVTVGCLPLLSGTIVQCLG